MDFKNIKVKEIGKEFKIGERTFYPVVQNFNHRNG